MLPEVLRSRDSCCDSGQEAHVGAGRGLAQADSTSELPTIFPSLFGHVSPHVSAAAFLSSLPASTAFISPTFSLCKALPGPQPFPRVA